VAEAQHQSPIYGIVAEEADQRRGSVRGIVTDAATGEPIVGTTIIVEGTSIGTISDARGQFTISNITPGAVSIIATYLGYEVFRRDIAVRGGEEQVVEIALHSEAVELQQVVITAQINRESENVILGEQREAVAAVLSVGAMEMSRKGLGDARGAVAQVSGVSRQEGVKNVFVRGLGDRYNATYLNGFNLPSEDPEYKNIALEFFGSDIIQNIGVNKVFTTRTGGDVGGAAIDIHSKELVGRREFAVNLGGGVNGGAAGARFLRAQDGVNYLGASRSGLPAAGVFDFRNGLDPSTVRLPLNHSYGASGGRRLSFGRDGRHAVSLFGVASHSSDYSFTDQTVRDATAGGVIYKDQRGERSTIETRQLALANARLRLDRRHEVSYNFLLIHASDQWVGDYTGINPTYADAFDGQSGFTRRQQNNDNLLIANQLSARFALGDRWDAALGAAYNSVRGLEPDRRENNLSLQADGSYTLTGSNSQRRFFSKLTERDLNVRAAVRWKIDRDRDIDHSNVSVGYIGRAVDDDFSARDYSLRPENMSVRVPSLDELRFDDIFNEAAFDQGRFSVPDLGENSYRVSKTIHSGYVEATHEFSDRFSAVAGVRLDAVEMTVDYDVHHIAPGSRNIERLYPLPSLSLKYDPADRHSLRLGLSRSYTLPQSKEIAPYKYVNVGFSSEGNPDLAPSDNYNADLKWDWYPSSSELVSVGAFYKYIKSPIGRVDQGNSAGLLIYDNISERADVAGVELEVRRNLLNTTTVRQNMRRLSLGVNASRIYSNLEFDVTNTAPRRTRLEGASPWLVNGDLSYNYSSGERVLNLSLMAGWFSDRIHTLGTRTYNDIMEESVATLSMVASYKLNNHWAVKFKAGNILNSPVRLSREFDGVGRMVLEEYRKGVDVSLGVSFEL
jgi:TonB-dependent receptor